jgi:hypothetical protein
LASVGGRCSLKLPVSLPALFNESSLTSYLLAGNLERTMTSYILVGHIRGRPATSSLPTSHRDVLLHPRPSRLIGVACYILVVNLVGASSLRFLRLRRCHQLHPRHQPSRGQLLHLQAGDLLGSNMSHHDGVWYIFWRQICSFNSVWRKDTSKVHL